MKALSLHDPTVSLPMPELEDTIYARTIHARWGGEWDYNLEWKLPIPGPIRVGWLRAIFAGQSRVEDGLSIDCPVFVATSASTVILNRWSKRASHSDSVLDVDRITAQAWRLGRNIHIVRVKNGLHDLFLSPPEVRGWLFDQIAVWLDAYVPEEAAVQRPGTTVSWGRRTTVRALNRTRLGLVRPGWESHVAAGRAGGSGHRVPSAEEDRAPGAGAPGAGDQVPPVARQVRGGGCVSQISRRWGAPNSASIARSVIRCPPCAAGSMRAAPEGVRDVAGPQVTVDPPGGAVVESRPPPEVR